MGRDWPPAPSYSILQLALGVATCLGLEGCIEESVVAVVEGRVSRRKNQLAVNWYIIWSRVPLFTIIIQFSLPVLPTTSSLLRFHILESSISLNSLKMMWLLALLPLVAAAPTDSPTQGDAPGPGQVRGPISSAS